MLRRRFIDVKERQVHLRTAGEGGVPLLMLHASPGSARHLEPLIEAFGRSREVIAPDTPGNGDSTPLPVAAPTMKDYADALVQFLDARGLTTVDVYGAHTGAHIAVELAIVAPGRIRKIVLDGLSLYSDVQREEMISFYAPAMKPDSAGMHLLWAFQYCRDQALFFPWFKQTPAGLRGRGLPPAHAMHEWTVDVLKSIETYHLGYHAVFRNSIRAKLPLVPHEILAIATVEDPLSVHLDEVGSLLAKGSVHFLQSPPAGMTRTEHIASISTAFFTPTTR